MKMNMNMSMKQMNMDMKMETKLVIWVLMQLMHTQLLIMKVNAACMFLRKSPLSNIFVKYFMKYIKGISNKFSYLNSVPLIVFALNPIQVGL